MSTAHNKGSPFATIVDSCCYDTKRTCSAATAAKKSKDGAIGFDQENPTA
jgi:hypothetical protein